MAIQKKWFGCPAAVALAALLLTLVAACGGSSSAGGANSSSTTKPVVIGVSLPLSGPAAGIGKIFQAGTNFWQSEGTKILGRPVHLVIRDDKGTAEGGATVARQFIDQDHVDAVVGPVVSDVAQAELPLFKQANLLDVTASAFPDAFDASKYPLVFPIQFSASASATLLKNGIEKVGATKVGILAGNNAIGQALTQILKTSMSGSSAKITSTQFFQPLATDVTTQLGKLRQAGADIVVVLSVLSPDLITTMKGMNTLGWTSKVLFLNPPDPTAFAALPKSSAQQALSVSVTQGMTNPISSDVSDFRDKLLKFLNQPALDAQRLGQYAYNVDALNMIAAAAAGAGSLDGNKMKAYIEGQGGYHGLNAAYQYSSSAHVGVPAEQGPVVVVASFKNGIYDRA